MGSRTIVWRFSLTAAIHIAAECAYAHSSLTQSHVQARVSLRSVVDKIVPSILTTARDHPSQCATLSIPPDGSANRLVQMLRSVMRWATTASNQTDRLLGTSGEISQEISGFHFVIRRGRYESRLKSLPLRSSSNALPALELDAYWWPLHAFSRLRYRLDGSIKLSFSGPFRCSNGHAPQIGPSATSPPLGVTVFPSPIAHFSANRIPSVNQGWRPSCTSQNSQ